MPTKQPFGSWASPLDPATVAGAGRRLGEVALAADGAVWWTEGRPAEGGRVALMRAAPGGVAAEVGAAGASVRSRAREYGGGAWALSAPDLAHYVEADDQRIYELRLGHSPRPLSAAPARPGSVRYADLTPSPGGGLLCVRETHPEGGGEPAEELVAIGPEGRERVLACGRDFYSFPRPSPDGRWLAFTCWDHPAMPWDGTELWLAPAADPGAGRRLAGGPGESVFQPAWDAAGRLNFVSDRDGWWNLYRLGADGSVAQLSAERAELGHPQWQFGGATYGFLGDGRIACVRCERGTEELAVLDPGAGAVRGLGLPFTSFGFPTLAVAGERVAFAAAGPDREAAVVVHDLGTGLSAVVRAAAERPLDPAYASAPEQVGFATGQGELAYAFHYPPANPRYEGPAGGRPPLIVKGHGGPTAHATPALDAEVAFWTSRGFAFADVNYRGSSGHGRAYRERLQGAWGTVDAEDLATAARALAAAGAADPARLVVRGSSAGGFAALCALLLGDFAAGASYYGIGDLEALAADGHKFEARYLDGLIGPYPERAELYRQRSPARHAERLRVPTIVFQGLEDRVVPPAQAEALLAALARNGVPRAHLFFPGEGHGFRRAETRARCLEAELYFYGRVLGIEPADSPTPVRIDGLPPR